MLGREIRPDRHVNHGMAQKVAGRPVIEKVENRPEAGFKRVGFSMYDMI
jgi:hypothetical protein